MTAGAGFRYRAHGLDILAEFEVPELLPSSGRGTPDLRILRDPAAATVLDRAAALGGQAPRHAAVLPAAPEDGGGVFAVEDLGSFWVRDGRELRVAARPGADPGLLTLYILGSAMGLILFQRGALVLHGAAVVHDGRATLFLGPSGAGKSTIAARLGQAGLPILADDTLALWPRDGGGFVLHPSGTSFKLWRDAIEAAGLGARAGRGVACRVDKFYVANPRRAEDRPHEVGEILILGRGGAGDSARIEPLAPLEALRAITANAYRPEFVETFGAGAAQFRQAAALVARAPVGLLVRPWDHAATPAVIELLRRRWEGAASGAGAGAGAGAVGAPRGKGA